jgi:hypothetical protein
MIVVPTRLALIAVLAGAALAACDRPEAVEEPAAATTAEDVAADAATVEAAPENTAPVGDPADAAAVTPDPDFEADAMAASGDTSARRDAIEETAPAATDPTAPVPPAETTADPQ